MSYDLPIAPSSHSGDSYHLVHAADIFTKKQES